MSFLKLIKNFFLFPKKELNWWVFNWKNSKEFRKQLILVVLGFGIAGLIWGGALYWSYHNSDASFIFPFILDGGAVPLAIFGGLGLGCAFLKSNKKKFLFLILLGIPIWILTFLIPVIFAEWLWTASAIIFPIFWVIGYPFKIDIVNFLIIEPSLQIGTLWLEFFFSFLLIAVFYSLFFKKPSKLKLILIPPIWVAIFAIIAPIIGNLIGAYLFRSLLLSYLLTFLLITLSFALSLFKEIKHEKI
ncbi:hypothetical protein J7K91_01425 [bacterium]|nr:hypothetical protein [bacterium]